MINKKYLNQRHGNIFYAYLLSQFRRWHVNKVGDAQESEIKTAVKKFFVFLEKDKGFTNKKIMDSFKRK